MRLVALGQAMAGDDGVGFEVVRALGRPEGLEVVEMSDPSALIELLDGRPTLIVDAAVGAGPPGTLRFASIDALATDRAVSTHGIGLVQAAALARVLRGDAVLEGLAVLGIAIDPPRVPGPGLSPPVAAAVPRAVERVRAWMEDCRA